MPIRRHDPKNDPVSVQELLEILQKIPEDLRKLIPVFTVNEDQYGEHMAPLTFGGIELCEDARGCLFRLDLSGNEFINYAEENHEPIEIRNTPESEPSSPSSIQEFVRTTGPQ